MSGTIASLKKFSITRRFIFLHWLVTFAGILPAFIFIFLRTDTILCDHLKSDLRIRYENLLIDYGKGGTPLLKTDIDERLAAGGLAEAAYLLVDPAGRKMAGNLIRWPAGLATPAHGATATIERAGRPKREIAYVEAVQLKDGCRLLVGSVKDVRILADNALMEALIGALLLMLPIALIESAILVRFVSARTKGVSTVTRAIVHGDLSRRIEIIGAHDEFDHLAGLLNRTFDWLEMLIEDLNFVTNALAHELRSPLTRVRAELEKLGSARSAERTLLIQQISSDIDGMLRIISATLDLSRAETGTAATFTRFDMHRLIIDLYEVYDASAEERGVELVLAQCDEAECFGNPELIAQAVSNLLDNALRHSGATRVELGCSNQHPGWLLWVADNGVGIPEHDRAEAVRKFGRLDRARTTQGSGLGLAFVSAVAKIHGGELRLEDNRPGLRATLTLRPGPPPGASAS